MAQIDIHTKSRGQGAYRTAGNALERNGLISLTTRIWLWFGIALLLFMPTAGMAESLKVAFAHWPPWKITEGKRIEGIDADIVRAIGKQLDVSVTFTVCPWPRCIDMAKQGDVDLITSFGRTPSREEFVHYLGPPYITEQVVFYLRKDHALMVEKYGDLGGKKIGTIKGSSYFPEFDNDQSLDKTALNMEPQLFEMLSTGRIDLFIGYETVIDYLLAIEGFEGKFKKSVFRVGDRGSYIAMPKRSKALKWRTEITSLITEMVSRGEINRIIDDFLKDVAHQKPNARGTMAQ